jgi:peptide/nickel transport system substrate-binding protein
MRVAIAAAAATAVVGALVACSPGAGDDGEETELRLAGPVVVMNNPFEATHLFFVSGQALYDALIMVPAEGVEPEPMLAESWDIAEDGRTISFKLREDVDFQDGTHMDAAGVAKYLNYLFDQDTFTWKARVAEEFGASAEATGEYTLDIKFANQPVSYQWLWQFGLTAIASPALVDDPSLVDNGPIYGSGPYTVEEVNGDASITFVRNPDYWNPDAYPYDRVTVQAYSDAISVLNAVKSGQLDAGEINIPLAVEAEAGGLAIHEGPGRAGAMYILDHNGTQVPALGDVRVREAMARAFDREAILENINLGYGTADSSIFNPGTAEYQEDQPDPYPYDLDRAKELMAEAGYADGFDLTISYLEGEGLSSGTNLAPLVQTALGEIGINVTYVTTPVADAAKYIQEDTKKGLYPAYILNIAQTNWIVDFDERWAPFENQEFTDLIAQARGIPGEQAAGFQAIGKFLTDEIWYIAFSKSSSAFVSTPDIEIEISGQYPNPKLFQYRPTGS